MALQAIRGWARAHPWVVIWVLVALLLMEGAVGLWMVAEKDAATRAMIERAERCDPVLGLCKVDFPTPTPLNIPMVNDSYKEPGVNPHS